MTAAQLIAQLQKLSPETVVVKFGREGMQYDEVWFVQGTHQDEHFDGGTVLKKNRAKRVKGEYRSDYLMVNADETAAKTVPFVVIS